MSQFLWETLVLLQMIDWGGVQLRIVLLQLIVYGVRWALLKNPNDTEDNKVWIKRLLWVYWALFFAWVLLSLTRFYGLRVIAALVS